MKQNKIFIGFFIIILALGSVSAEETAIFENDFVKMTITPNLSTVYINEYHEHYVNITNKMDSAQTINFSFVFSEQLVLGEIQYLKNNGLTMNGTINWTWESYTDQISYLELNNKHYYYSLNVNFQANSNKYMRWVYKTETPIGKFDLIIWKGDISNPSLKWVLNSYWRTIQQNTAKIVLRENYAIFENEFAKLSIFPNRSVSSGWHKQYANISNKIDSAQVINFSFVFPEQLVLGEIQYLNNIGVWVSYTDQIKHLEFNNKHYYYSLNVNFQANSNKYIRWVYKTKTPTGKFDLIIWKGDIYNPSLKWVLDPYWEGGYQYKKNITINSSLIDSTLSNYPLLVKLKSTNFDFSHAESDGTDIYFTNSGGTILSFERERHNATAQLAEYWVKVNSVSSTEDTVIYMFYGNSTVGDSEDSTNVWSDYNAVWHMDDLTTSTLDDSTSLNNDGTKLSANNPIESDDNIYKAQDFSSDYVYDNYNLNVPSYTISLLITPSANNSNGLFFYTSSALGGILNSFSDDIGIHTDGKVRYHVWAGTDRTLTSTTALKIGETYLITCVWQNNAKQEIWINGVLEDSNTGAIGNRWTGGNKFVFSHRASGGSITYSNYYAGLLDEFRWKDSTTSAEVNKANYYNMFDTLVSFGLEEGIDVSFYNGSYWQDNCNSPLLFVDFGDIQVDVVATRTILFNNSGLVNASISLSESISELSLSGNLNYTCSNVSCSFTLILTPSSYSDTNENYNISVTTLDSDEGSFNVEIRWKSSTPTLVYYNTSDFGNCQVDTQSANLTILITLGDFDCPNNVSLIAYNRNDTEFGMYFNLSTVNGSQNVSYSVYWTPSIYYDSDFVGSYTFSVDKSHGEIDNETFICPYWGYSKRPQLGINLTYDFGDSQVDVIHSVSITFEEISGGVNNLTIDNWTTNNSLFYSSDPLSIFVDTGSSNTTTVYFHPNIYYDSNTIGQLIFNCTATYGLINTNLTILTGLSSTPNLTYSTQNIDFGSIQVDTESSMDYLNLTNSGSPNNITITGITLNSNFTDKNSSYTYTIDPNSNLLLYFTATPQKYADSNFNQTFVFSLITTFGVISQDSAYLSYNSSTPILVIPNLYRRVLSLDPITPLDDYQVRVVLNTTNFNYSRVDVNGDNIQFCNSTSMVGLHHWVQIWNVSGDSVIWVNIPHVGTSEVVFYYSYTSVISYRLSNFTATFEVGNISRDMNYPLNDGKQLFHSSDIGLAYESHQLRQFAPNQYRWYTYTIGGAYTPESWTDILDYNGTSIFSYHSSQSGSSRGGYINFTSKLYYVYLRCQEPYLTGSPFTVSVIFGEDVKSVVGSGTVTVSDNRTYIVTNYINSSVDPFVFIGVETTPLMNSDANEVLDLGDLMIDINSTGYILLYNNGSVNNLTLTNFGAINGSYSLFLPLTLSPSECVYFSVNISSVNYHDTYFIETFYPTVDMNYGSIFYENGSIQYMSTTPILTNVDYVYNGSEVDIFPEDHISFNFSLNNSNLNTVVAKQYLWTLSDCTLSTNFSEITSEQYSYNSTYAILIALREIESFGQEVQSVIIMFHGSGSEDRNLFNLTITPNFTMCNFSYIFPILTSFPDCDINTQYSDTWILYNNFGSGGIDFDLIMRTDTNAFNVTQYSNIDNITSSGHLVDLINIHQLTFYATSHQAEFFINLNASSSVTLLITINNDPSDTQTISITGGTSYKTHKIYLDTLVINENNTLTFELSGYSGLSLYIQNASHHSDMHISKFDWASTSFVSMPNTGMAIDIIMSELLLRYETPRFYDYEDNLTIISEDSNTWNLYYYPHSYTDTYLSSAINFILIDNVTRRYLDNFSMIIRCDTPREVLIISNIDTLDIVVYAEDDNTFSIQLTNIGTQVASIISLNSSISWIIPRPGYDHITLDIDTPVNVTFETTSALTREYIDSYLFYTLIITLTTTHDGSYSADTYVYVEGRAILTLITPEDGIRIITRDSGETKIAAFTLKNTGTISGTFTLSLEEEPDGIFRNALSYSLFNIELAPDEIITIEYEITGSYQADNETWVISLSDISFATNDTYLYIYATTEIKEVQNWTWMLLLLIIGIVCTVVAVYLKVKIDRRNNKDKIKIKVKEKDRKDLDKIDSKSLSPQEKSRYKLRKKKLGTGGLRAKITLRNIGLVSVILVVIALFFYSLVYYPYIKGTYEPAYTPLTERI